ncbi:MAG: YdcF family protein [Firmicutes bacterium]|nr:YdcF family protein [Bacillota bacterium]
MRSKTAIYPVIALVLVLSQILFAGCSSKKTQPQNFQEIIEEMVVDYGSYGGEAKAHIKGLLKDLETSDQNLGTRWEGIMDLWMSLGDDLSLNYDVLPDGLPDTDELCIVALGFQLEPDGSMRPELIQRLNVVLRSAEKYPNSYIVCTGGGTAAQNSAATEAGEMAKWLIEKGIDEKRIIVEDNSITTAQNAIFTYDILTTQYPKVRKIAIVSSDYHIETGILLFSAEATLRASVPGEEKLKVISNAAWKAPSGSLSSMFQAGALIELSGDTETAFEIYYDTYDIHELPPLK